ncbi:PREDICTED: riboflavin kinase [Nicrophorus vespilloides]|uniref:riboflavin kinase n=1 Tax=Nicrophorus vespilloides TaxID=110193 RepID=A0ABM1NBH0_NICVS|nr:PREDICTED: riboflavin kinase [Nicrophorus vespilloides]
MNKPGLPHFASGEIIKGFGRGSKELGIPTANYAKNVVDALPEELNTGIYFGFAKIDEITYNMVISIGWNPFYKNEQKSMETHIIHTFDGDLYGKILKIAILGYLRPELNFDSLEALINTINNDIKQAVELLDKDEYKQYLKHEFFA